ncbi:MAG: 2-oxo-4-hydroxy-4-carboxy-5-ureidoimidazoline decarboxylase [Proteobacteria bacterium]|nr:2-oxo-4-hydroxy-4-carboxy-5-ureidoimidazoline decarboxylase [Pseudomonadota bacterium]
MISLAAFNAQGHQQALDQVMSWCHCANWAADIIAQRPFVTLETLRQSCQTRWQHATSVEVEEALAAHPLIGDVALLQAKFAAASDDGARRNTAFAEQGQVLKAGTATLDELARLNVAYKERHGFIFIIFAKHLSAEEMLAAIAARIDNDTNHEFAQAAAEQTKIMLARIATTFGLDA